MRTHAPPVPTGTGLFAPLMSAAVGHRVSVNVLLGIAAGVLFTPAALFLDAALDLQNEMILYLVPVVLAAARWGFVPALAAAVTVTAAGAYLFNEPYYSFAVLSPRGLVSRATFVAVAAVTSHLTALARQHAAAASQSYIRLQNLYDFTRQLAAASTPEEIFLAIQHHASAVVGTDVIVLSPDLPGDQQAHPALAEVSKALSRLPSPHDPRIIAGTDGAPRWLARPLPATLAATGHLLVDLGTTPSAEHAEVRNRIDTLLDEAVSNLERLDLTAAVSRARLRHQGAALKEAIIGSATHGLRTPLSAIIGSASVLADAAPVARDPQLRALARNVIDEARRLDGDIQKMLDAASLSATALEPSRVPVEPSDIVNAALAAAPSELRDHQLIVELASELPFVHVDQAMIREALRLLLDNAARYSPAHTTIHIAAVTDGPFVRLTIEDEGIGIEKSEAGRLTEKFYRGSQVRATTRGSGLGLWIANAFIGASKGRLALEPRTDRSGTRAIVHLPASGELELERTDKADDIA